MEYRSKDLSLIHIYDCTLTEWCPSVSGGDCEGKQREKTEVVLDAANGDGKNTDVPNDDAIWLQLKKGQDDQVSCLVYEQQENHHTPNRRCSSQPSQQEVHVNTL